MKKIYNWALCLMTMVMALTTFSSCMDEDTEQSMVLSGQWNGDFGMYYSVQDRRGNWVTYNSYDTDIVFYPEYDYATYGHGKQVDYYKFGPYEYQYYYFDWQIRNGVLYLTYPYDHNLDVAIYDYRMNNSYFQGRFENTKTTFKLRKLVDYYDWNCYSGNYGYYFYSDLYNYYDYNYGYGYDYGYSYDYDYGYNYGYNYNYGYGPYYAPKTRSAADAADTTNVVIRRGNRFNDK